MSMDDLYYDLDGQPISRDEWGRLWTRKRKARSMNPDGSSSPDDDSTRIGWDRFDDVTVSTVWLGIDHNFGDGPPLIFETMIFGGPHNEECWRYPTRAEAEAGHATACALVRNARQEA